jgi:hypothetical protein
VIVALSIRCWMAFSNLNFFALLKWPSTYQANVYCASTMPHASRSPSKRYVLSSSPLSTVRSSHPACTGGLLCYSTHFCVMVICSISCIWQWSCWQRHKPLSWQLPLSQLEFVSSTLLRQILPNINTYQSRSVRLHGG